MANFDEAYANAAHIEGSEEYPTKWAEAAEAYRIALDDRYKSEISYGPSNRAKYDLLEPEGTIEGIMIFVHGGYWMRLNRTDWSHLAEGANARGWAVAMPSYDLCPSVSIASITQQIATAVMTIAATRSVPLSLVGHSAGGHLVARMLAPGMLPRHLRARIQHVVPISPIADLEPLIDTSMNRAFRLDTDMAHAESPLHQPAPETPVTIRVGAAERPAFLEQAQKLETAWDCPVDVVPDLHHFNIIEALEDEASDLVQTLTPAD
ncbi:MAG: alpha/beta hydrolase [Pseudomonadota bacterium]